MALPMIHLLSAHMWAQDKPELIDCPEYYLGVISPDAIHIRDGKDKSNKDYVHLENWKRPNHGRVEEYWKEHRTPFDIGYGIHVLLDGNWAQSFRADFPQILLPSGKPDPEKYYHDIGVVDYGLYLESPLTERFEALLKQAEAPEGHMYLTRNEFSLWRDQTLEFYHNHPPADHEPEYITREYTLDFLKRCMGIFDGVYVNCFDHD